MAARSGCSGSSGPPAEQAPDTDVLLSAGLAQTHVHRTAAIGLRAPDHLERRGANVLLSVLASHGVRR